MPSGTVSGTKLTLTKQVEKRKRVKIYAVLYDIESDINMVSATHYEEINIG